MVKRSPVVLITGGAGFIGSNIARLCLERGYTVRVLDDFSVGSPSNLTELDVELVKGDVTDESSVGKASKGAKYIFHEAAASSSAMFVPDPTEGLRVNVLGFANTLSCAAKNGVEKVVYAMTSTMYGDSPLPYSEQSLLVRQVPTIYSSSLLDRYFVAKQLEKTLGIDCVGLVYFSVYGPGEASKRYYANIVSQFLWAMMRNKRPILYGDGTQSRDFIHVRDVALANVLAAESAYSGNFMNVGTGTETSMNEIVSDINSMLGKNLQPIYKRNPNFGYNMRQLADTTKARREIGFRSSIDVRNGLKSLLKLYRSGTTFPELDGTG